MRCDRESFVIGVFDTTYSCNGFASYKEGILFARHLIDLVAKDKDIQILFKEKKDRKFQMRTLRSGSGGKWLYQPLPLLFVE